MKRFSPTLEAFSWADVEDHDTDVRPIMQEDTRGEWVRLSDVRDLLEARVVELTREGDVLAYGDTPGFGDCDLTGYFGNDSPGRFAVVRLPLPLSPGEDR